MKRLKAATGMASAAGDAGSRSTRPLLVLFAAILVLSGCATQQQTGTLIGGATGALIGSTIGDGSGQNIAIAAGAVAGALIGSEIGRRFDEQDQSRIAYSMHRSEPTTWTNTTTGQRSTVFPGQSAGPSRVGQSCREFTVDTEIGNRSETAYGTACRQADGSWKIISS